MNDSASIAATTPYALTASQPSLVGNTGSTDPNQNIDQVSQDFESVFLTQMLSGMFSGDQASSFFGSGLAGDVTKGFLLNEYGKMMAQAGGIGIAASVKQELLKLQETK